MKVKLLCADNTSIDLELSGQLPDTTSVDFADCSCVKENGWYGIELTDFSEPIIRISLCVNENEIVPESSGETEINSHKVIFFNHKEKQVFSLLYDLAYLSFRITFTNGTTATYFTPYLLCFSKSEEDKENIDSIVKTLLQQDFSPSEQLIFPPQKDEKYGLFRGQWHKCDYRSLCSYVQLVGRITKVLQEDLPFFRHSAKHKILHTSTQVSYEKATHINTDSFNWLMQNADQLYPVQQQTGIQYDQQFYLPCQIQSEVSKKSFDVYENRVLLCFIRAVLKKSQDTLDKFRRNIDQERQDCAAIKIPAGYTSCILLIKNQHITLSQEWCRKLEDYQKKLEQLYRQYAAFFEIKADEVSPLRRQPRMTKLFQEVKTYRDIYSLTVKWFKFGEIAIEQDDLLLRIKTLDKLFEYYCLLRLLDMLIKHEFKEYQPSNRFPYSLANKNLYSNEIDVPNTYYLRKDNISITFYYQPVVSSKGFENGLSLFRTNSESSHWTPDFILQLSQAGNTKRTYIILDAKFSDYKHITKNYLDEIIRKYESNAAAANDDEIKMICALQGRIDETDQCNREWYTPQKAKLLSQGYTVPVIHGVHPMNTHYPDIDDLLWEQIQKCVPYL